MRNLLKRVMTSRKFLVSLRLLTVVVVLATVWVILNTKETSSAGAQVSLAVLAERPVPPVAVALLDEARQLEDKGRIPDAVLAYEKVIDSQPGLGEAYFRLGALYFKAGLISKAKEIYLKAVELGLDETESFFRLGYIEESQGKFSEALVFYLKSEVRLSKNPDLFYNIGNVYARQDQKDRAIEYYKKTVISNPSHMDAFVNLSVVSFHQSNFADAQFYVEKAMKLGYQAPKEYLDVLAVKMKEAVK